MLKLSTKAHNVLGRLDYALKILPNKDILLDTLMLQEAKASSQVENIFTTNDKLFSDIAIDSYDSNIKEIRNYKRALYEGYKRLTEKELIGVSDIEALHQIIKEHNEGIRKNQAWVNKEDKITKTKTVIYTSPNGVEVIHKLLSNLLNYIYDDEMYNIDPLIKISVAHYQFETIHPFSDGNGRIGRILNILFLMHKEFIHHPALFVSNYILNNKDEYNKLIKNVTEQGMWYEWVEFMLTAFIESSNETLIKIEQINDIINEAKKTVDESDFKMHQNAINTIFEKVYCKIQHLTGGDVGLHRETASNYLKKLESLGILSSKKIGRKMVYFNTKLINLFKE